MMNNIWVVGRIANDIEVKENEEGKKSANVTLAIPRSYKNAEGVYETDFIDVSIFNTVAARTSEYCKKGDLIAVKGSLQKNNYEKDGEKKSVLKVIVNNVSFLSSKSKEYMKQER